jgi:DNA repair photolyase
MPMPLQVKEIKAERVLNPTSIDLGEFVINPYKGCELNCVYCYVKTNRATSQNSRPWGSYVDVRANTPEQLEKELDQKSVSQVLLGSTTELFQPVEEKFQMSRKILEILNRRKISYVILTRAPEILNVLPLLTQGFCRKIYFTVNLFDMKFKRLLEPKSADFKSRAKAIQTLMENGIPVITYFCPVLPWISEYEKVFDFYPVSDPVEFEFLNFTLKHIDEVIGCIEKVDSGIGSRYRRMQKDKLFYDEVWSELRNKLQPLAVASGRRHKFFEHQYEGYFQNTYHDDPI